MPRMETVEAHQEKSVLATTGTLAKSPPRRLNTQRFAWGVLLVSFAIFCVIAGAALVGLRYFLFQSRVPLVATVEVARGTPTLTLVGSEITPSAVTRSREIFGNSTLTTGTESQATISFTDAGLNRLIAAITVESGSALHLSQGTRPRFDWVSDAYWVEFGEVYGVIDVFVPDNLDRALMISLQTTLGPAARFTAPGHYTLIAVGQRVQLVNYSGSALLGSQPVPAGHTGSQPVDGRFTVALHPDPLGDAVFSENNVLDLNNTTERFRPQAWICRSSVDNVDEPLGSVSLAVVDSRPALRLFRGEGADSHGDTGCWHGLGPNMRGLDVSPYAGVSLRATFMIKSQSLSTCGIDGSECPLMLAMDYIPVNGGVSNYVKWFHGFYAFLDPNRSFPTMCNSCSVQHEQITPGVWYTYEIRNLFESFAPERRPETILNVRFYASGHQYEVYVSQVVLLVDQQEIVLEGAGG